MMFAASQMLARELGTEGEVLGRMTIGTEYHLLIMGITPKLLWLHCLKVIRERAYGMPGASHDTSDDQLPDSPNSGGSMFRTVQLHLGCPCCIGP